MTHESIDHRLLGLERSQRRLRSLVLLLAVLAGALVLLAAAPSRPSPDIVSARAVRILDEKGTVRATLTVNAGGEPLLLLTDRQGEARASLFVTNDGRPALGLRDAKGRNRAMLALEPGDIPFLSFRDEKGKQIWSAP
jgi:hypothetical protein